MARISFVDDLQVAPVAKKVEKPVAAKNPAAKKAAATKETK
jgi:hypothetical protein